MRLIFSGGRGLSLATDSEASWRERGAYLLVCVSGELTEAVRIAKSGTPLRIESEDGESVLDLSGYHAVSEINYRLEDGLIILLLRPPTDGEELMTAAATALRAGVNGEVAPEEEPHICAAMRVYGRGRADALAELAPKLTDTEIIDAEDFVPDWRPGPQTLGAVVRRAEIDQVYRVLQAHDSTQTPDWTPETQPALYSICHTQDPAKAKPWAAPMGISGMYYKGDVYRDEQGQVWRQTFDGGNVYDAATLLAYWEVVA